MLSADPITRSLPPLRLCFAAVAPCSVSMVSILGFILVMLQVYFAQNMSHFLLTDLSLFSLPRISSHLALFRFLQGTYLRSDWRCWPHCSMLVATSFSILLTCAHPLSVLLIRFCFSFLPSCLFLSGPSPSSVSTAAAVAAFACSYCYRRFADSLSPSLPFRLPPCRFPRSSCTTALSSSRRVALPPSRR